MKYLYVKYIYTVYIYIYILIYVIYTYTYNTSAYNIYMLTPLPMIYPTHASIAIKRRPKIHVSFTTSLRETGIYIYRIYTTIYTNISYNHIHNYNVYLSIHADPVVCPQKE